MLIHRWCPRSIRIAFLLAATAQLLACQAVQWKVGERMTEEKLERVLSQLRSSDAASRKVALETLPSLMEVALSAESRRRLLDAATEEWEDAGENNTSAALIDAALSGDGPSSDLVIQAFPKFNERTRWHVVHRLAELGDEEAASTYLALLQAFNGKGLVPRASVVPFVDSPDAVKLLFPRILDYAHEDDLGYELYLFSLRVLEADGTQVAQLRPFQEPMLTLYKTVRDRMRRRESPKGDDWIWEEEYSTDRAMVTLLLDLMRFGSGAKIQEALDEALTSRDARVRHFAVMSKLRHGAPVDPAVVESVAASAEVRNWLFEGLAMLGKRDLFPKKFANQESLAESDMVGWLIYPMELGRTPHEIELMQTFENKEQTERFYLFRFRTRDPHWAAKNGWMAGLSGPFVIADMPTSEGGGATFSSFTKWQEMSAQEHFENISGVIAEAWKRQAKEIEEAGQP